MIIGSSTLRDIRESRSLFPISGSLEIPTSRTDMIYRLLILLFMKNSHWAKSARAGNSFEAVFASVYASMIYIFVLRVTISHREKLGEEVKGGGRQYMHRHRGD